MPEQEFERAMTLSDFNLDYPAFEDNFKDLARLTASVAGTEISLVGFIDSFTQWIVSSHGLDIQQTAREDTVCQYTIMSDSLTDMAVDERLKNRDFVVNEPKLH